MKHYNVGDIVIHRIVESICADFEALRFFPSSTPQDWAEHSKWLAPWAYLPDTGNIILTIQAFLIQTRRHTILVDTCVGDDKTRPQRPFWDMMKLNTLLAVVNSPRSSGSDLSNEIISAPANNWIISPAVTIGPIPSSIRVPLLDAKMILIVANGSPPVDCGMP